MKPDKNSSTSSKNSNKIISKQDENIEKNSMSTTIDSKHQKYEDKTDNDESNEYLSDENDQITIITERRKTKRQDETQADQTGSFEDNEL